MTEDVWYAALRRRWQPEKVRLLLIAESAPDSSSTKRRFFYATELSPWDNLFRGVVSALYGPIPPRTKSKADWLDRLRADGVFLIDLVPYPVNRLGPKERRDALTRHVPALVRAAADLTPQGIMICHTPTFKAANAQLRDASLTVLHDEPLPFPLGNMRARFVSGAQKALRTLPSI
jgi:hypothetical protein